MNVTPGTGFPILRGNNYPEMIPSRDLHALDNMPALPPSWPIIITTDHHMHHSMSPARCVTTLGPALLVMSLLGPRVTGAEGDDSRSAGKPYSPRIAAASDEGERAIRTVRVPAGLKVELF